MYTTTFEKLSIAEYFTVGGNNPKGSKCIKMGNESSQKGYGSYRFAEQTSGPNFLIRLDVEVTSVPYEKSTLPQWPAVADMIHAEATLKQQAVLASLAACVIAARDSKLLHPGVITLAETALADYQGKYK